MKRQVELTELMPADGDHGAVIATRNADSEWRDTPWLAWKDTVNLLP